MLMSSRSFALFLVFFALGCKSSPSINASEDAGSRAASSVDVVAHASTQDTWDAEVPPSPSERFDVSPLRAKNHARLDRDASPVWILKGGSPESLGERLCESVVPKVPKDTPILLKPNIGGFDWFKDAKNGGDDGVRGRITDPSFVRGVIHCLKARGHTRITIAEGWGATHKDWEKLVAVSGYAEMAKSENTPLVAMDDDGVFDTMPGAPGKAISLSGMEKTNVPTLRMPKILKEHLEAGLFISLPKIKAHRYGVVSMSIKGVQGTIMLDDAAPYFRQKWRMHKEISAALELEKKKAPGAREAYVASLETFARRIADVLEVEAPQVILAEGAPAMSGDGFQKMVPSAENVAIGGTNPVLVDVAGSKLLGLYKNAALGRELLGRTSSPLIDEASRRFSISPESLVLKGDGASLLDTPRPYRFYGMPGFEVVGGGEETTAAAAETPIAHAAFLKGEVVIDGSANDLAWKGAPPIQFTTDYKGDASSISTRVRFLYSDKALYALWELQNANLNSDASKNSLEERAKLYEEDCSEIFLAPDPNKKTRYFEIEVGPLGHFLDIDVDREKKTSNVAWSSGVQVQTTQNIAEHRSTIEYALRSPEIVKALAPGARLPLGLYRIEGKAPRVYLAWSPPRTAKPNFHVPEAFGTLVLDPR